MCYIVITVLATKYQFATIKQTIKDVNSNNNFVVLQQFFLFSLNHLKRRFCLSWDKSK